MSSFSGKYIVPRTQHSQEPSTPPPGSNSNASRGMPPIGLNINGIIFNLDKEDYVLGHEKNECVYAFEPLDLPAEQEGLLYLGRPFLEKFYSVYDFDTLSVGLALGRKGARGKGVVLVEEE